MSDGEGEEPMHVPNVPADVLPSHPRAVPAGLHVANMPSGGGTGYLGTINGVHVYSARITNLALLCSSRIIRAIDYDVVHGEGDVVDFTSIEGDDLAKSRVRLRFSQSIEWTRRSSGST
jgi:hypothetical protein